MIVRKMTIIFWSDATKFSLFRGRKKRRKNRQKQGGAVRRAGGWKGGAGGVRIATPACGLVRNDIFGKRGGGRRRHTWVPPYGGISRSAVERGNEDAVPYGGMVGDARQAGGVGRRPLRLRGGRDDVGIVPYKKLVGRHIKECGGTGQRGRRPPRGHNGA